MNTEYTRKVVEASMLAAGRSLSLAEIAQLFDPVDRPDNDQLRSVLGEISESLTDRGVELLETAQGFRMQVRREVSENVSRLWPERPPRYSRALLETLAIIAYRQPLTRAEIENIRGVQVNPNIIKTLAERNWIRVVGHREVPGRPELLGTTRDFLDYFGLKALEQLPPLAALKSLRRHLAKTGKYSRCLRRKRRWMPLPKPWKRQKARPWQKRRPPNRKEHRNHGARNEAVTAVRRRSRARTEDPGPRGSGFTP
jgi:segregation and condensation protein B